MLSVISASDLMSDRSPQSSVPSPRSSPAEVSRVLSNFTAWLDAYGENSWDYQSFFASPLGGRAKSLYYRHRILGTAAVAPMIFCEAFLPGARRLFSTRQSKILFISKRQSIF
jgi:hypothetical protein